MKMRKPLIFLVDEASRIFDRGKENTAAGIPQIDILTTQNRHSDIYIFGSTQEISKVTNSLIANTSRKIIFKQNSGKDIQEIAQALQLNDSQKELLLNLDLGEAVIKQGILPPFLIKSDYIHLDPPVTDYEIGLKSGPVINSLMKHVIPRSEKISQKHEQATTLSDDIEKQILSYLCKAPLATTEEIIQAVKCNRAKISRVSDSLIYKNLIKKIKPLHFKRGGGRILFEPTAKARELFERWDMKYSHNGKCGLESYYYLNEFVVPFYTQQEFKITWEGRSRNSTADLIVTNDNICLAIELQLTEKNSLKNLIRNNSSTGIDETIVICKSEGVKDRILKEINKHKTNNLGVFSIQLLSEFATENDSFSGI